MVDSATLPARHSHGDISGSHRFSPLNASNHSHGHGHGHPHPPHSMLSTTTAASSNSSIPANAPSMLSTMMIGAPSSSAPITLTPAEAAAQALTAAFEQMDTARSASSSSAGGGKAPRRRNRAVLSCLKCHQRRVKCDRKQPCTACIRYGAPEDCKVPDNPKAQQQRQRINSTSSGGAAHQQQHKQAQQQNGAADTSDSHSAGHHDAHMDGGQHHDYGNGSGDDEVMDGNFADEHMHQHPNHLHQHQIQPHGMVQNQSNSSTRSDPHSSNLSPDTANVGAFGLPASGSPGSAPNSTGRPSISNISSPLVPGRSRFSSNADAAQAVVPSQAAPAATGDGQSASTTTTTTAPSKKSYSSHRSADVLTRFISEYEGQFSSSPSGRKAERPARSYAQEHIEEIWSFCENLPTRNLDILIGSYLNDVDWMYQIVDADAVSYRLLPDLVGRILDPHLSFSARPQEWTNALRWGDLTRLSLLGGMILGSVQATGETVLKLTFKQAAAASPGTVTGLVTPGNAGGLTGGNAAPANISGGNNNNNHNTGGTGNGNGGEVVLSSGQSVRSGSSGGQDSRSSAGAPPSNRSANSVKTEVLSVLESQVRRLLHLATAVEGPTPELVKARLVMLNFIKNEARLAEPEAHEFLHETVEITMKAEMHQDPGPLSISADEKEDRRRLFYNIYAFDRFAALFFGKRPCFPEEEITTKLPQERWLINGKEHLFSFLLLKARLAKIVTRIASAALEVPVDGDKVSQLEVELQEFSKMTQGTPFHPSLPQIPPELSRFHTLDRQRHLYLICFHSVREALHRLAFFQGPMISAQHAQYSREACAQSAVVLLETQRSLRLRIFSSGDLCCFYIPFFNLEPAITLIISAIVVLQAEPAQREADYIRNLPIKKAKVDYYMQWAQHALDLLRSMPEDIAVATQGSFLLSRVLRKAAIIVEHSTRISVPGADGRPTASGAAAMASLERTSAWMQDLFCDENGQRMKMPYLTAPPRPPPFTRTASRPETFLELQRADQSVGGAGVTGPGSGSGVGLTAGGAGSGIVGGGAASLDQESLSASSAGNFSSSLLGGSGTHTTNTTASSSFPASHEVGKSMMNDSAAIAARSNSLGTDYSTSTLSNAILVSASGPGMTSSATTTTTTTSNAPPPSSQARPVPAPLSTSSASAPTSASMSGLSGPPFGAITSAVGPTHQGGHQHHHHDHAPHQQQQQQPASHGMMAHLTSFPTSLAFDLCGGGAAGGSLGALGGGARAGPSLAEMGLGFFDTLFDSRNQYAPLGAAASSMAPGTGPPNAAVAAANNNPAHHHHQQQHQHQHHNHQHEHHHHHPHHGNNNFDLGHGHGHGHMMGVGSSGPSVDAGLVAPASGGSGDVGDLGHAALPVSSSGGVAGGVNNHNGSGNGGGGGGFVVPSVGPSPEAGLASMGLEAYMNAWLLSIQNDPANSGGLAAGTATGGGGGAGGVDMV